MKKVIRLTESDLVRIVKSVINEESKTKGTIKYDDGRKYTGEYVIIDGNKIRNGKGTITNTNGDKYEGSFKDDLFRGKGIYTWADGTKYEGDFKNNQLNGYGIIYYPSGKKQFEGDFKNNQLNGQVIVFNEDGSISFQGKYVNGKEIESSETKDVTKDITNGEYIVQKGDSLSKIGQKLGVQWKEIATLNNIKNVNLIRVGQKLKIPKKTESAKPV